MLVFVEDKPSSEDNGGRGAPAGTHVLSRIPSEMIEPAPFSAMRPVLETLNSIIASFEKHNAEIATKWVDFARNEFPRTNDVKAFVAENKGKYRVPMRFLFSPIPGPIYGEGSTFKEGDLGGYATENVLKAHATCSFERNVADVDGRGDALLAKRARVFEYFKEVGLFSPYFGTRKPRQVAIGSLLELPRPSRMEAKENRAAAVIRLKLKRIKKGLLQEKQQKGLLEEKQQKKKPKPKKVQKKKK